MAELGSVFEDHPDDQACGPDLRVSVEVPRAALGACLRAPVPERLAHDGDLIERAVLDGDTPGYVELHLPTELPARAQLRLRGQGGVHPRGRAGDLLVLTQLVDRPPRDDEHIIRTTAPMPDESGAPGVDITTWVLLALALSAGGVLLLLAI